MSAPEDFKGQVLRLLDGGDLRLERELCGAVRIVFKEYGDELDYILGTDEREMLIGFLKACRR